MSTATLTVGRVTQGRAALSEWTKLRSVRSTRWALLATVVLVIGIGILACVVFENRWPNLGPDERHHFTDGDLERDAMQDLYRTVARLQVTDLEHHGGSSPR